MKQTINRPVGMQPGDPTPAEIRQKCEAIQATWSEQTRQQRTVCLARRRMADGKMHAVDGWELPEVDGGEPGPAIDRWLDLA